MKIIHIVEAWRGGIASYVQALIAAQAANGHQVLLVADEALLEADPRDLPCDVETYRASRNPLKFGAITRTLSDILSRHPADVVHVHSTFPGVYTRWPRALHSHIVYTPHGWSFLKLDSPKWMRGVYGVVERALAGKAHTVMCMSFQEIQQARRVGIPADRLVMIHTGIEDLRIGSHAAGSGADSGAALGVTPSPVVGVPPPVSGLQVGFFGRLDYQKGADLLSDTARLLAPDRTIHIFGAHVRGGQPLQPDPRIKEHGWVPHQDLTTWMAAMDAIIIPSRWEGFSLTALEALRAGKPIIVSNRTSLSEVVVHGYNGFIMEDYTAEDLASLINGLTPAECERMGANARQVFLGAFTFDRFYERVMGVYGG